MLFCKIAGAKVQFFAQTKALIPNYFLSLQQILTIQ